MAFGRKHLMVVAQDCILKGSSFSNVEAER